MFALFRRKPRFTHKQMFEELGKASDGIVAAAAETSDVVVGLKGAAVVVATIKEAKRFFDLEVRPNTIFGHFALAAQEQDVAKLAEMTKNMANALDQVKHDVALKGALMHFWFNGER